MGAALQPPQPFESPGELGATTDGRASTALGASLRAHPLLVAVVTLVTVLAGLAWSAVHSPTYEASAQVLLTPLPDTGRALPRLPLLRASSDPTRLAQTAANLLDSHAAAAAAARALGDGWTAARVEGAVDVEPQGQSDVLSVTAKADDSALAARVANAFARAALDVRSRVLRPIVASLIDETERNLRAEPNASSPAALDLAQRLSDLRAIGTDGDPTLSLTRRAEAPTSPIGPSRGLLVLLTLIAGIAVGIGSALVVDMLGPRRLADASDAVAATGLPVLARVPALGIVDRARRSPLRFRPAAAAPLRMLEHQLAMQPYALRRVLLAGVSAGDGATTSVAELGLTLSRAGHEVLLVDADTRRPTLAARLGAPQPAPLEDLLDAQENESRCIVKVPGAPRLKLVAIGAQGHMGIPSRLAAELPQLLADAVGEFDFVLVDAPPLGASGEALQVAAAVDAVVLVLRPGRTRLEELESALGMLDRVGHAADGLLLVGGRGSLPARPSAAAPAERSAEGDAEPATSEPPATTESPALPLRPSGASRLAAEWAGSPAVPSSPPPASPPPRRSSGRSSSAPRQPRASTGRRSKSS